MKLNVTLPTDAVTYLDDYAFRSGLKTRSAVLVSAIQLLKQHELSLAYVNGQNLSTDAYLIDMPPVVIQNKIQYKNETWFNFVSELKSEVVFRQNQFPNYNFETNIIVNNELTPVLVDISSPPKGYHLLHFYSEMTFKINKKNSLTTSFSVQNIMNTTYRDYLNRQRFFVDEMGRNIQIQLKFNY